MSARTCGCDVEAGWVCKQHDEADDCASLKDDAFEPWVYRKARPVFSGVVKYFPDALLAVAHVSQLGNDQHNPGEPLNWARHKSTDQLDAAMRHLIDYASGAPIDTDGGHHLAKAAWRILAELQLEIERNK